MICVHVLLEQLRTEQRLGTKVTFMNVTPVVLEVFEEETCHRKFSAAATSGL
jgi:hypothetical protein